MPPEYFIDSNVFVNARILDKKYGSSCAVIMRELTTKRLSAATSTLAILEVSNALRKLGMSDDVVDEVRAIYSTGIVVHELLNVDVRLTAELFGISRVSPYDCLHAAIMKRTGLDTIISTDPEFEKIPQIVRVDPLAYKPMAGKKAGHEARPTRV